VEGELTWAPDSSALAFFSNCGGAVGEAAAQTQLYLSHLDGSAARQITDVKGFVGAPAFSPDGKTLAFLYVEGATRPAGALAAMKPPSGVIGEDGVEIQRVALARTDAAEPIATKFATPARLHVYEFDWGPDSKSLAYVAADPPGENNWWVAKLYTQPLDGEPKAILAPAEVSGPLHGLQIAVPRWSPDGKAIAFIGGLMSDQGSTGGDVWLVPAQGGQPRDLTPQRAASPSWMTWDGDDGLFVNEIAGGNTELVRLRLEGTGEGIRAEASKPVFSFAGSASDGRIQLSLSGTADRSQFVFTASGFDRPVEIYAVKTGGRDAAMEADGNPIQLTRVNDGLEPAWGKTVSLDWTNEGFQVQGWLMFPKDYDSSKKYPMIVEVHGGPAAAVMGRWGGGAGGFSATAFSAFGYFVLMPNPRGSYGQGEVFTQANRKDFGYGDLRDILAGVDTVLKQYPVDAKRVGLTGWSYGGFMSMFAVTQTDRFRAAVSGAGISDWQSYYGENSIDQWMIPYFGASVYDDPAVYAKSSAISYIKKVHTPTLSVVGDRDGECPAPQSFEFWHALRDQHVPSQLVVYANEGHGFVDPAHHRDVMERALDWFARYMPAE
jgi:dipeptidyl aminopeptidase/acylaminoacyl peptidase